MRVKVPINRSGQIRFRIIRISEPYVDATYPCLDYPDVILVDNIVVSYPEPKAVLTPTGIDSEGTGFAKIGRVGAFTEPFLSKGLEGVKPRMTYSPDMNGLPSFIDWEVSVTNADFVWRWCYLNQAYGTWNTNKMSVADGELVGNTPMSITNRIGDIEYYYVADVAGTEYKFVDFAHDEQKPFPTTEADSGQLRYPNTAIAGVSNYYSRIREGVSPWQEMRLEAIVFTNLAAHAAVTNNWTMELVGDHMWRGFLFTPTNYAGALANVRFVGKNKWKTKAAAPSIELESKAWHFPIGEVAEIPMGGIAIETLPDGKPQDIPIDATSGYLMFEFNDESGAFTMNRAEYQDFNMWTPKIGQKENKYIGDYMNTSYVGQVKTEYPLDLAKWDLSQSTSSLWGEDFDTNVDNVKHKLDVPFGLNTPTPNGWTASNGMFINSSSSSSETNRAVQLQGRGVGTLSLIDPTHVPNGIGTVSFTARLAQSRDISDFYCDYGGFLASNYAISAKAALTHNTKAYCDASPVSPSLSLVAYNTSKGCYEFRITRVAASNPNDLWGKGKVNLGIYKWQKKYDANTGSAWTVTPLKTTTVDLNHSLVPDGSGTVDNKKWTGIYFAAYTSTNKTSQGKAQYEVRLEGGVACDSRTDQYAYSDLEKYKMRVIRVDDKDNAFDRGSYGVGACDCPGVFGNIQIHELTAKEDYKTDDSAGKVKSSFKKCSDEDTTAIKNAIITWEQWWSSTDRIVKWGHDSVKYTDYQTGQYYDYGVAAPLAKQQLYFSIAPYGNSSSWEKKKEKSLDNFATTEFVFPLYTLDKANIQISTGGDQSSLSRTDVVIDDVKFSQWAGDTYGSRAINEWAVTDAWVSRIAEDAYQGAGSKDEDVVAVVANCGYDIIKLNDSEYIYVFTNTSGKAVSFMPKQDMTIKEIFALGGGGGGGSGGGGGGGGSAIWVTNTVECSANEDGIMVCVGNGGAGGGSSLGRNPAESKSGGNSYVSVKDSAGVSIDYIGYGGGAGGTFNANEGGGGDSFNFGAGGGGSACDSGYEALGSVNHGSGFGGAAERGAPGGGGGGGLRGVGASGGNSPLQNGGSVICAGTNGVAGIGGGNGGSGGSGFQISQLGESEIRYVIAELLTGRRDGDKWLGGGGGGGSGISASDNYSVPHPGFGGMDSGGQGGYHSTISGGAGSNSYDDPGTAKGSPGVPCTGGGGGGGSFFDPVQSGGDKSSNWIIAGGAGGSGLVAMHVKIKDRFVMLQPMRGEAKSPMSIRTPFLNGISHLSFSWKDAHSNAVLKVQVATNNVDSSEINQITEDLADGGYWSDFASPIRFSELDEATRAKGSTNILIGLKAPISGVLRLVVDPQVIEEARELAASTNVVDAMYGTVIVTGAKVYDDPQLDDRSWWGWNIMPTYELKWSSLYDPVTLGPGRSLGLNFSGRLSSADVHKREDYDAEFADDPNDARYDRHDPFVQTPRFTNGIGSVMFKARLTETNHNLSGWISISGCVRPEEEVDGDTNWTVLTNIEVKAGTTVFEPFMWRMSESASSYQALRLSAFGAAEGRYNSEYSGQPFGENSASNNPTPIQRVLIDEVVVTQPMAPRIAFENAYPFRHNLFSSTNSVAGIASHNEQPLLGETFGMQVQVRPAGMEDELDVRSIRVYMAWYAGTSPWGYDNWKNEKFAMKEVELKRAEDWSESKLIYRSNPNDSNAFIPAQIPGDYGYQVVQYHIWAEYENKNGVKQAKHHLCEGEWKTPYWYFGIRDYNSLNGAFSAYTVLDSISPKRAWFNEINTYDAANLDSAKNQYIEVAVPSGFDVTGWSISSIKEGDADYGEMKRVATFGSSGVAPSKTVNSVNSYAFIALQSPDTKDANTHSALNDGTWLASAFSTGGEVLKAYPYALRLTRPSGIIEHEVVFMSTNISTSIYRDDHEGSNFCKRLQQEYPQHDWVYAGADAYGGSLGVYTNYGGSSSCWSNKMLQTPGLVNRNADNTMQYIDSDYFEPPSGAFLWVFADVDPGSEKFLKMVVGDVTNTSAVIIVPQNENDETFSTSIVYVVSKWFEMDKAVTNEVGKTGADAAARLVSKDREGSVWTLDLKDLRMSSSESRKFNVTAYARESQALTNHIDRTDPYYPAIVDWLQGFDESEIKLAEVWSLNDSPVVRNGKPLLMTLKQMYWLDIPPVSEAPDGLFENSEWVFKGGMGSGALPNVQTNITAEGLMTNIRVAVTMMISNRLDTSASAAHAPYMLRGMEVGSTSLNRQPGSNWRGPTFKITGALQNGLVNNVYRPLRWFTFGPESFVGGFTRTVDIIDPLSTTSPGYSYEWYKYSHDKIWYKWSLSEDTNRPPVTVELLNDETALFD